jgi:hypothetical protein
LDIFKLRFLIGSKVKVINPKEMSIKYNEPFIGTLIEYPSFKPYKWAKVRCKKEGLIWKVKANNIKPIDFNSLLSSPKFNV